MGITFDKKRMMKRKLLSILLWFGLIAFADTLKAQTNLENALAEGFTPEEMETLYLGVTPTNHKEYLKNKGFKYDKYNDGVYYYKKNQVVSLVVAFADSRVVALGFASSPQKYYQAEQLLDKSYKKMSDVKADGVIYKQWKKGELVFRADTESYTILLAKEIDL